MGRFNINFLDQPTTDDPDPDAFRDYFLAYATPRWCVGSRGASFRYRDDDRTSFTSTLVHSPEHGFLVWLAARNIGRRETLWDLASLRDASELTESVSLPGHDARYPLGCFVGPRRAWALVEAFLTDPTARPGPEGLIATRELVVP